MLCTYVAIGIIYLIEYVNVQPECLRGHDFTPVVSESPKSPKEHRAARALEHSPPSKISKTIHGKPRPGSSVFARLSKTPRLDMTLGIRHSVWHTPTGVPRSICLIDHGVLPSEEHSARQPPYNRSFLFFLNLGLLARTRLVRFFFFLESALFGVFETKTT